jgi:hypothetical protein
MSVKLHLLQIQPVWDNALGSGRGVVAEFNTRV